MSIDGKVALVTGGSRGIGRAIALRLAREGTKVAINYKTNEAAAQWVVDAVAEMGGEAMSVAADVSQSAEVEAMVKKVADSWDGIDILVNNAGVIHDGLLMRMTEEVWDEVININLKGTFNCTKAVLRFMVRKRWGRIINVVSVVGMEGNPGQSNYAASKAGVIAFARSIAKEVASRNITVNSVAPGYIVTEIVADLSPEFKELIFSRIPQNRFGTVDDVANMVGYLASEEANTIWATAEKGSVVSPNKNVSLDVYAPLKGLEAAQLTQAERFVFDGSDLAPPAVGGDAMFTGLQDFVDNPGDIQSVLEFLEEVADRSY